MSSIFSPAIYDEVSLGAMVTHYEPRIHACLISANINSTEEALFVLAKFHSLENLRDQYRMPRSDFEHQDQTRRTAREPA